MDAQLQIRQNALEAQEYLGDLLDWQKSLKARQGAAAAAPRQQQQQQQQGPPAGTGGGAAPAAAGARSSAGPAPDRDLPAVRGRSAGGVQPAPRDLQRPAGAQQPAAAAPAAHTYKNYSKWDRFDVDAALQQVDQPRPPEPCAPAAAQEQPPAHAQPAPAPSPPPPRAPRQRPTTSPPPSGAAAEATALKDRGNKLFQAGHYEDAVACYTQSIAAEPSCLAYANRAMATLKLGRHAEAEADCTAALAIDAQYVKALQRRGTAHRRLGNPAGAAADFEEALRLEPGNRAAQAERDEALGAHLAAERLQDAGGPWQSIPVAEQQQEQQEQGEQQQREDDEKEKQQQSTAAVAVPAPLVDGAAGSRIAAAPAGGIGAAAAAAVDRSASRAGPAVAPRPASPASPQQPPPAAEAAAVQLTARLAQSLRPPRTSHDFEATWRSFRGDERMQARYLQLVPPQQLPGIFKSSLTAQVLASVLTVALGAVAAVAAPPPAPASGSSLDAAHAVELVEQLVRVPRFDMAAMCLSGKDKAALRPLWDAACAGAAPPLRARLAEARPKYRL